MKDIAVKSGVARSTVSYVLNGRTEGVRIPEETRQRILNVATELGYRRNELARAVVTGKSRMLGFLATRPEEEAEFKSRVLSGAVEEATEQGYGIKVIYLTSVLTPGEALQQCIEWRLAGLLLLSPHPHVMTSLHPEIEKHVIEVVVVEGVDRSHATLKVNSDEASGIEQALDHLLNLGHRRIGMLSAKRDDGVGMRREASFRLLCEQKGLEVRPGYIDYGDWQKAAANRAATKRLLNLAARPTALICSGDPAAMVALSTARAAGLQTPRDLSVIGFGNYSLSPFSDPPLTTIAQPFRLVGRTAVRCLIERIENIRGEHHHQSTLSLLPPTLVVRESTAPPFEEADSKK